MSPHAVSSENGYDPRAVANAIIEECQNLGVGLTNLGLQKLTYFAHSFYLLRTNRPLVQGFFEAWTHGPVHPAIYAAFKRSGAAVICGLAKRRDLRTDIESDIPKIDDPDFDAVIRQTLVSFGSLSAGQLVRLSHARDGPWDVVYKKTKSQSVMGLRISNDLIKDRFKYHKLSVAELAQVGEPDEDSPLTAD